MLFQLVRNSQLLHNQNDHYRHQNSPLLIHFLEHLKTVQYFPTYFPGICHKIIPRSRPRLQARMHAHPHKDTHTHRVWHKIKRTNYIILDLKLSPCSVCCTRVVREVSGHYEYLENRWSGIDVRNLVAIHRRPYCVPVNSHSPLGLVSRQWDAVDWACVLCDRRIHKYPPFQRWFCSGKGQKSQRTESGL